MHHKDWFTVLLRHRSLVAAIRGIVSINILNSFLHLNRRSSGSMLIFKIIILEQDKIFLFRTFKAQKKKLLCHILSR